MSDLRMAEIITGQATYHVVRGDRFACGAKRLLDARTDILPAHEVDSKSRCLRIGCSNDYAKADSEARRR